MQSNVTTIVVAIQSTVASNKYGVRQSTVALKHTSGADFRSILKQMPF